VSQLAGILGLADDPPALPRCEMSLKCFCDSFFLKRLRTFPTSQCRVASILAWQKMWRMQVDRGAPQTLRQHHLLSSMACLAF